MGDRLPRKLVAIVYADVAGYSRLTGDDEDATHRALSDHLDLFSRVVESHGGQVMHFAGDAVLARFDSVLDAMSLAVEVQTRLAERNAGLPTERRVEFRVGVNIGDVIEDRGDIFGDGVNVAARLEALAEPGGICVSEAVRNALGERLPLRFEFLGEQSVKNIKSPVRAYRTRAAAAAAPNAPARTAGVAGRRRLAKAILAIAVLAAVTLLAWQQPWAPRTVPASIERMAYPMPDRPSIVVLPFTNMSNDPEQEYFSDGMTEDVITDLSKISGLFVIARNSAFTYKGKSVKIRQVAEELGVRYVLEGSIRRAGQQVRINAQLIDATTGGHLWAERYDGELRNVFALQDEVTRQIVAELAVNLTTEERARSHLGETADPEAYDAFLAGLARYRYRTPGDFKLAIPHLEKALALDPGYARAHAALAALYLESWRYGWFWAIGVGAGLALDRSERHLDEAMKAPTPLAHIASSFRNLIYGQLDKARAEAERAITLDPNNPEGYNALAQALLMLGDGAKSLETARVAARLDPNTSYQLRIGQAQFFLGQYAQASETLGEYVEQNRMNRGGIMLFAAALGHLGRAAEASAVWSDYKVARAAMMPTGNTFTFEKFNHYWRFYNPAYVEQVRDGLRLAGVDSPPVVIAASTQGITLEKPTNTAVNEVYRFAAAHCESFDRKSFILNSNARIYEFGCS